jgi:hypothetical protein
MPHFEFNRTETGKPWSEDAPQQLFQRALGTLRLLAVIPIWR